MQGAAGSLAGDVFADWGTIQSILILGVMASLKRALPFAMCRSVHSLPRPGTGEHAGNPRQPSRGKWEPWGHSGRGQPPSSVPEEAGTGTSLLCRLLWPLSGLLWIQGVPWSRSQSPQQSGQLRARGALLRPQRFLHPSEGESPHQPWAH